MAYITKEAVKVKRELLKNLFPEFKFSVKLENYSSARVTILESPIEVTYSENCAYEECGTKVTYTQHIGHTNLNDYEGMDILKFIVGDLGNFDKSDIMTDYFHVGYYSSLYIGQWNKDVVVKERKVAKKRMGKVVMEDMGNGIIRFTKGDYQAYVSGNKFCTKEELQELLLEKIA